MANQENFKDLPEFHIFLNFFEKIFGFSPEKKDWKFDPGKIKIRDTILLLLWPIILSIKLLCPTEEKAINKKLDELDEISSETEFEVLYDKIIEIFNLIKDERFLKKYSDFSVESLDENGDYHEPFGVNLDLLNMFGINFSDLLTEKSPAQIIDTIISDKLSWQGKSNLGIPKLGRKILFLFVNLFLLDQQINRKLTLSISYYFLMYFLFIKSLMVKTEKPAIFYFDIISCLVMLDESFENNEDIKFIILFWLGLMGGFLFREGMNFLINDYKNTFLKPENIPIKNFQIHFFNKENQNYYAFIDPEANNKAGYKIGFIKDIKFFQDMDYYLEFIFFKEDPDIETFTPILSFKTQNNDGNKTDSEHILFCLYVLWEKISTFALEALDSRNEFISDPTIRVKKDLNSFKKRMKLIVDSYGLFDEYMSQKDLSRAVETLDMEYDNSVIEQIRGTIKRAKKYHLSPNLRTILLEANEEMMLLFHKANLIRRQKRLDKKYDDFGHRGSDEIKQVKKYLKDNPHHFKIIQLDDIKNVRFTSDDNFIRNARREILAKIARRYGKNIAGSRIAKELEFEK
jgi:hypothetical protein